MISGLRGERYEDKLSELGILSLKRLAQFDMVQTFKIVHGIELTGQPGFSLLKQEGKGSLVLQHIF